MELRDPEAVASCFAPDGEFHSPVLGAAGFQGRHAISELFRIVFASTSAFQFTDEVGGSDGLAYRFRADFGRRPVQGVIWLDLDEEGHVSEMWVFARPLAGVAAVSAVMGPGLAARRSPALGMLTRVSVKPLLIMAWIIDRVGALLVRRLNKEHRRGARARTG